MDRVIVHEFFDGSVDLRNVDIYSSVPKGGTHSMDEVACLVLPLNKAVVLLSHLNALLIGSSDRSTYWYMS